MKLEELYDIQATASYILRHGYTCVALQFPDHLLKISVAVSSALRIELEKQSKGKTAVKLYILADTTYGSCCGDEIAAAHINADCIIHYGHACLSPTSKLPVWYVFGRASIDIDDCVQQIINFGSDHRKGILVLFDLEFTYGIPEIKSKLLQTQQLSAANNFTVVVANIPNQENNPCISENQSINCVSSITCIVEDQLEESTVKDNDVNYHPRASFSCGGLNWTIPSGSAMEDFVVVWIGQEGPAFTNVMLTFNSCCFARYDPDKKYLIANVSSQSKFLMRRYYLIERAKDASIVGIVVGTLGVAGYREMVSYIKRHIKEAGKKSYTLAMGKPNPAKLANFPECDMFVLVACPQTALLDSKDFMVPVITPFEAVTAWRRGTQWTGTYSLDFRTLKEYCDLDIERKEGESVQKEVEEARFSFIKGSYVEDNHHSQPDGAYSTKAMLLAKQSEKALQLQSSRNSAIATRVGARSGAEYFLSRTFQGLEMDSKESCPASVTEGRTGRAAGYADEPS